jgi:hypothetical protein
MAKKQKTEQQKTEQVTLHANYEEAEPQTMAVRGLDLQKNVNIQAIKEFIDKLTSDENVNDLKASGQHIIQAKIRFVNVLCRLFGWDNWQDTGTRAIDPTEDRIVEFIMENPTRFAGLTL